MSPSVFCKLMGVVFIAVAIWGFIDGEKVLIFHVNTPHNVVHLLSGLAALVCGVVSPTAARAFCIAFGVVYGLVAVAGFAGVTPVIDLLHLNDADNWLHAGLSLAFLVIGLAALVPSRSSSSHAPTMP
jgi:hypothetical protein